MSTSSLDFHRSSSDDRNPALSLAGTYRPLSYPRNARTHSKKQIRQIAGPPFFERDKNSGKRLVSSSSSDDLTETV